MFDFDHMSLRMRFNPPPTHIVLDEGLRVVDPASASPNEAYGDRGDTALMDAVPGGVSAMAASLFVDAMEATDGPEGHYHKQARYFQDVVNIGRIDLDKLSAVIAADPAEVLLKVCRHDPVAVEQACLRYRDRLAALARVREAVGRLLARHTSAGLIVDGARDRARERAGRWNMDAHAVAASIRAIDLLTADYEAMIRIMGAAESWFEPKLAVQVDFSYLDVSMPDREHDKFRRFTYGPEQVRDALRAARLDPGDMGASDRARAAAMPEDMSSCPMCGRKMGEDERLGAWSLTAAPSVEVEHAFRERDMDGFVRAMCPECAHAWMAYADGRLRTCGFDTGRFDRVFGNTFGRARSDPEFKDKYDKEGELLEGEARSYLVGMTGKYPARYDFLDLGWDGAATRDGFDADAAVDALLSGRKAADRKRRPKPKLLRLVDRRPGEAFGSALDRLNGQARGIMTDVGGTAFIRSDVVVQDIRRIVAQDVQYMLARYARSHEDGILAEARACARNRRLEAEYDALFQDVCDQFDDVRGGILEDFPIIKDKYLRIPYDRRYAVRVTDGTRMAVFTCGVDWMAEKASRK